MQFALGCNDAICHSECKIKNGRMVETSSVVTEVIFLQRLEEGLRPRKTGGLYSRYCSTSELKRFSPLSCSSM